MHLPKFCLSTGPPSFKYLQTATFHCSFGWGLVSPAASVPGMRYFELGATLILPWTVHGSNLNTSSR